MNPGDIIDIIPHGFSHDGRAVGRLPEGPVVFVRGGLPGRRVRARVEAVKKRLVEAVAEAVLAPAPNERPAPCAHAETCGGCPWQCLPYADQLLWKRQLVRDALDRIGGLRDVDCAPALPSPAGEWGYRNKMEFAFGPAQNGAPLGLRRRASRDVEPVTDCLLQTPLTMRLVAALREHTPGMLASGVEPRFAVIRETRGQTASAGAASAGAACLVEIITSPLNTLPDAEAAALAVRRAGEALMRAFPEVTGFVHSIRAVPRDSRAGGGQTARAAEPDVAVGEKTVLALGNPELVETLRLDGREIPLRLNHGSFFQVNAGAAELLYATALYEAGLENRGETGEAPPPQTPPAKGVTPFANPIMGAGGETPRIASCWDVYCGVGGLALAFAPYAKSVLGLESAESAVALARRNAKGLDAAHCRFERADAARLGEYFRRKGAPDLLVADPPRAGLAPEAVQAVLRARPPRLVLVSCDPGTLARDLALLAPAYAVGRVQPVDLFPQTPHVECVVALSLKN